MADETTRDWSEVRADELEDPAFGLTYDLALDVWRESVVVARRRRDRALVILRRSEDGEWRVFNDLEGSRWCVPWEPYTDRYEVVVELDAPRAMP